MLVFQLEVQAVRVALHVANFSRGTGPLDVRTQCFLASLSAGPGAVAAVAHV